MDVKAYIESGILEQFVLGNTSPEETEQIILLSKSHPEIRTEIDAIEEALIKVAESYAQTPSEGLKTKVFANLDLEENDAVKIEDNELPFTPNFDGSQVNAKSSGLYRFYIAASIILLGVSTIGNIWLYSRWQNTENQLASISTENSMLTNNDKIRETKYSDLQSKLATVLDPKIKSVKLNGLPLMPQAYAQVYWDTTKSEVYINVNNLPQTSSNEQYQLWAIVDGKPQDAGVFNADEAIEGLVKMKNANHVTAFAVTIEKKGGSINPTMEKMVLMGAVI